MGGAIEMTERNGTFVLGLGAQKAGSSWLHAQLNHRRDAEFGFLKEYHIHDALTLPEAGFSNRRQRSLIKPRKRGRLEYDVTTNLIAVKQSQEFVLSHWSRSVGR